MSDSASRYASLGLAFVGFVSLVGAFYYVNSERSSKPIRQDEASESHDLPMLPRPRIRPRQEDTISPSAESSINPRAEEPPAERGGGTSSSEHMNRARAQAEAQASALEVALRDQPRDAVWASQVEYEIETVFRESAPAGVTLTRSECAKELCRISYDADNIITRHEVMQALETSEAVFRGEVFAKYDIQEDGSVKSVVFASREGSTLPHQ